MHADQATPVTTSPKGAEPGRAGQWLAERLGDSGWRDRASSSIGHGRSNLTYRVSSPVGAVVPRRPVAAAAHDTAREQCVPAGLAGTAVALPRLVAFGHHLLAGVLA
jgi:hypothetical protein